jgi:hypothetical protein
MGVNFRQKKFGNTERGSDIDQNSESAHHINKKLEDTEKGSDFYGTLSVMKQKPNILPKPKCKTREHSICYVREEERGEQVKSVIDVKRKEHETEKQSSPIYENQMENDTKLALPPRKPLKK